MRLVALPVPQEVADRRRAFDQKQPGPAPGSQPRNDWRLMNWSLFVTNVSAEVWAAPLVAARSTGCAGASRCSSNPGRAICACAGTQLPVRRPGAPFGPAQIAVLLAEPLLCRAGRTGTPRTTPSQSSALLPRSGTVWPSRHRNLVGPQPRAVTGTLFGTSCLLRKTTRSPQFHPTPNPIDISLNLTPMRFAGISSIVPTPSRPGLVLEQLSASARRLYLTRYSRQSDVAMGEQDSTCPPVYYGTLELYVRI